ncbi:acyl-CoA thioesterase [Sphingomonas sp.]|uniref:acyl-CoA thioesterase n=1 Tax=Sphingomonas sp. TaxID=28214 RepID=UPI0025CD1DC3|nr:acyl-CoA thioesterase [Sphingomonas sp.]
MRVPLIRVTAMPADTNPYGGVFGGWLMSQMALAAGSLASRHSRGKAVVVAADELRFIGPMGVGDELSVFAELVKQGRSSMRIAVEAVARERDGDRETKVASGEFTFVALDENGRPRAVPSPRSADAESTLSRKGRGE